MRKLILAIVVILGFTVVSSAQFLPKKFGKGFHVIGKDSTFYMKFGFRFQNLYTSEWSLADDKISGAEDHESAFLIRRSRFKFDGWALTPKIKYKFELGLSNRDNSGGISSEFRTTPRFILDASVEWNFYENFSILFGQRKLPGNRERVISSGNMQFVDRSRLNSRYNIDRDMGLQLKHKLKLGKSLLKSTIALTQGEGRNVTEGNFGGSCYTFHLDFLPMGKFASKGDYVGSDIKREPTPKLGIAVAYDFNQNAVRERGQNGSFIQDSIGNYVGRDLNTFFADLMFKYRGLSVMMEYVDKRAANDNPFVLDGEDVLIGTFYTGTGFNVAMGYLLKSNYEIAVRYTDINPTEGVSNDETHYTLGFSKYVVGHKLKIQTDFSLIEKEGRDDALLIRAQMDIHF
ncbi:MAG: porin [Saprospiraceae bacterium]